MTKQSDAEGEENPERNAFPCDAASPRVEDQTTAHQVVNREDIARFSELFRHADIDTHVILKTFSDGENGDARSDQVSIRIESADRGPLIDAAHKQAERAAQDVQRKVFCSPIATFSKPNSAKESDLANGLALSVELDANPSAARAKLEALLGPATLVIESGGIIIGDDGRCEPKLHLHWRLNEPTRTPEQHQRLKEVRKLAARLVGGDRTCGPVVHPMRWAGSVHRKGAPRLSRIVSCNEAQELDLDHAIELLEEADAQSLPFVGFVSPSEERPSETQHDDVLLMATLVRHIVSGESYHAPLRSLAMRHLKAGMAPGQVVETLRGLMSCVSQETRDIKYGTPVPGRWQSRYDDIPRLVNSAQQKLQLDAPWSAPIPLPPDLPEVPSLEPNMLPPTIRGASEDIASRMQVPLEFVAVPTLVALGACLGRKIGIRPKEKDEWTELANLWGCIIGKPGVMKTPAMNAALAPLRRLEEKAHDQNKASKKLYEQQKHVFAAEQKAAEKKLKKELEKDQPDLASIASRLPKEPQPPANKRHIVNDATYEALGAILQDNPQGVLYFRDELLSMLFPLDRGENAPARGFFLTAWSGHESHTFDRITRGQTHIPACFLAVLGSSQPAKFAAYLRKIERDGIINDGLIARFSLLVCPNVTPHWENIDRRPDEEARAKTQRVFERFADLDPKDVDAQPGDPVPFLRFAPDAQEEFNRWLETLERRLRSDDLAPMLEGHLAKYRKLVPALALIFHLVEETGGPVALPAIERAIKWAAFLEAHAVRVYASAIQPEIPEAKLLLRRLENGELQDGFTLRDVQRHCWTGLTEKSAIERVM